MHVCLFLSSAPEIPTEESVVIPEKEEPVEEAADVTLTLKEEEKPEEGTYIVYGSLWRSTPREYSGGVSATVFGHGYNGAMTRITA